MNVNDLIFFVFGVSADASPEKKKAACVKKAYLDLCRTLQFVHSSSDIEKGKNDPCIITFKKRKSSFRDEVETLILSEIDHFQSVKKVPFKAFDDWHKNLVLKIQNPTYKDLFKDDGFITVGQAQKWINMTIKYMRILDVLNPNIPKEAIHVPLDDYILKASQSTDQITEAYPVKGLGISKEIISAKVWSKIDSYEKYSNYQAAIREKTRNKQVDWEDEAWIAESTRRANEE